MKLELLPAQMELLDSNQREIAIVGGLGSAKTQAAIIKAILTLVSINDPKVSILYTMPSFSLLTLRVRPGFEETLTDLGIPFTSNKSSQEITTPYGKILLKSFSEPDRIVSFECLISFIDELDILSKEKADYVYRKVVERTRQKIQGHKNQIIIVTTPDQGYNGFVYEKFGNITDPENYKLIKAATIDNIYLPEGYVEQISANYTPEMRRCFLYGDFVSFAINGVYTYFDRTKHSLSNEEFIERHNKPIEDYTILIGADFNIGACCVTFGIQHNNHLHIFAERSYYDTHKLAQGIRSMFPTAWIESYPDAAGSARNTAALDTNHEIMNSSPYNLNVMVTGANPRILDRVNYSNTAFYKDLVTIDTVACPNITKGFELQNYDEKTQQPEKSSNHEGGSMDDWIDAATYLISALYPINKPVVGVSRI